MSDTSPIDRLLHVADIHFWRVVLNPFLLFNKRFLGNLNVILRRRREFATHRAEAFSDALAEVGIDQILLTGDLTSTATDAEFKLAKRFVDGLERRGLRVWVLPGNHDVYTYEARRAHRFERYFSSQSTIHGHTVTKRLRGGTPLVLVPTVSPNVISSRGIVTPRTREETAKHLETLKAPFLAAGHYPLLSRTRAYSLTQGRRLTGAADLRELLGTASRPLLYLCGHAHRFSYVQDSRYPGLSHLATGAFLRDDSKESCLGEFSEIHVLNDGFRVFRHRYQGEWIRELAVPCTQGE